MNITNPESDLPHASPSGYSQSEIQSLSQSHSQSQSQSQSLSGLGIHSGIPCTLLLQKSHKENSNSQPSSICFPKKTKGPNAGEHPRAWQTLNLSDLGSIPRRAAHSTLLVGPDYSLRTPEHLFAALLFFPDSAVEINCDAEELPFLDGSAWPFAKALSALFPSPMPRLWREYASDLVWEKVWGNGFIRVKPAEHFKVIYHLQRFELDQHLTVESSEEVWNQILPARSFAFFSEWKNSAENSLMAGADGLGGILLAENESQYSMAINQFPQFKSGPYPLLHPPTMRFGDEPIRHKILDLIGDLALMHLALPKLEIEIQNGGHWLHHELMDKLTLN